MQLVKIFNSVPQDGLSWWVPVLSVVNLKVGVFPVIDDSPVFPSLVIPEQQLVDKNKNKDKMVGMAHQFQSVGAFE